MNTTFLIRGAMIAAAALAVAACDRNTSRDQIKVVGSSTVYPFTTAVAERFVNIRPAMKPPVIESTGTGAGMSLFCAGVGPAYPDIVNASRRMKTSEYETCKKNGVTEIMEIQVGIDGIALAEATNGPKMKLTREQIYLALAANPMGKPNTAKLWSDIDPSLPNIPIQVLGPPSTSGTRDALVELILEPACAKLVPTAKALKDTDKDAYAALCTRIRDDSAYVDKGENDNLIVQNLTTNPNAIGIFGYSYLEENKGKLVGVPIDGVEPTYATISDGSYPGARPLLIYVKKQHLKAVPGLTDFLAEYVASWDPDGPLTKRGMIAAHSDVRARSKQVIDQGMLVDPATLH